MRARRLPLLVDAFQWKPPSGTVDEIERYAELGIDIELDGCSVHVGNDCCAELRCPSRAYELRDGDWIIRREREDGTVCIYAISDAAFRAGYAPLADTEGDYAIFLVGPDLKAAVTFHQPNEVDEAIQTLADAIVDKALSTIPPS
jgi:hypothetical protein